MSSINLFFTNNELFSCFSKEENPEEKNEITLCDKIEEGIKTTFMFIKTEWGTINESRKQIGRLHKIVSVYVPEVASKVNKAIASLGLLAGIDFLFTLINYPDKLTDFLKNIGLEDIEGSILSGLSSFVITPCDALSSMITFISSLADLGAFPPIAFLGLLSQPLALTMLSYSALRGIYDLVWLIYHWIKTPSQIVDENGLEDLRVYLSKQLEVAEEQIQQVQERVAEKKMAQERAAERNVTEGEPVQEKVDDEKVHEGNEKEIQEKVSLLKAKKVHILSRRTDKKIVTIMKNLQVHLNKNPKDYNIANKALKDINTLLRRKVVVIGINTVSTIALETAIVAGMIFQISPVATPALGLIKGGILTGKTYYDRYFFDAGLNCPEFLNVSA